MINTRRGEIQGIWHTLDGYDFRLLEAIDYFTHKYGMAYPSRELLAKHCGCDVWTVSRHTSKLKRLGILWVTYRKYRRKDGTFRTRSNIYRILGCIGAKIRQLTQAILTGVRQRARTPKTNGKKETFDISFVKDEAKRSALERFSKLGSKENSM